MNETAYFVRGEFENTPSLMARVLLGFLLQDILYRPAVPGLSISTKQLICSPNHALCQLIKADAICEGLGLKMDTTHP